MDISIGSTIWRFDINRRVYPPAPKGKLSVGGGPIWREHWRPEKVVSENKRSWITDYGSKVPKKDADSRLFCFNEADISRAAYVQENRYKIVREVERINDYETLTKVAEVIGYKPDAL